MVDDNDKGGGIVGLVLLWLLFGAFIVLILSPIDLIPELTGPVGFIDDVVYGVVDVLIGALIYTRTKRRKKIQYAAGEKADKEVGPVPAEFPEDETPFLPEPEEKE